MSTVLPDAPPTNWTIADVHAWLPGFPADRIRVYLTPGTATEQDVLEAEARSNRICELIDGTLEKMAAIAWTEIGPDGSILGGDVLPGFELPLAQLFARAEGPKGE